ncbi:heme-binding-like protein At3g10130, chloroplastic isoform X2 [Primulina huaijiensis]|uniref:heme-binding-like protein At3g10130, chloroplastic isoform X2 n=1 Tax=Primulina huaijiensis TaxID=1492673 RepID=UPI003CC79251
METVPSSVLIPLLQTRNRKSSSTIFSVKSMETTEQKRARRRERTIPMSPFEARVSLVAALASLSQRLLTDLASETAKYVFPSKRFETRNLEEALMSVPDLETVEFKVLNRTDQYEIREVENTDAKQMEMTTPVFTRRVKSEGTKMEMTTPVITKRADNQDKWTMSFVMPSKYGADLPLPKDSSVTIKEVPKKIIAVVAFSGFVTDEEVKRRESTLRTSLKNDTRFRIKEGVSVEVAQYNPPFTLPFSRRNEISLEVERKQP